MDHAAFWFAMAGYLSSQLVMMLINLQRGQASPELSQPAYWTLQCLIGVCAGIAATAFGMNNTALAYLFGVGFQRIIDYLRQNPPPLF